MHPKEKQYHKILAQYFMAQPLFFDDEKKENPNVHKCIEQPWQQTKAEMWGDVTDTLTDLWFIEAKVRLGMVSDLQKDYLLALEGLPEAQEEREKEKKHQQKLDKYRDDLIAYAKAWSEYRDLKSKNQKMELEEPNTPLPVLESVTPWTDEKIKEDNERIKTNPTRLDRIKLFSNFVISEAHNFQKGGSQKCFCIQQAYNHADSGPVSNEADKVIESQAKELIGDMFLLKKNSRPPFNAHPGLIRTLEGRSAKAVSITPDGRLAVSESSDNTLRVWDITNGKSLRTLKGHSDEVNAVSITPDGRLAVSGSSDNTLKVWDIASGACEVTFYGDFTIWDITMLPFDGFAAGMGNRVLFFKPFYLGSSCCFCTTRKIWTYGENGQNGNWDNNFTVDCIYCGKRFVVLDEYIDIIHSINRDCHIGPDDSPCLKLPDKAWEEPKLLSECPKCHKPLKFNPFVVDKRDRYD